LISLAAIAKATRRQGDKHGKKNYQKDKGGLLIPFFLVMTFMASIV
jgi:hypothetical protein